MTDELKDVAALIAEANEWLARPEVMHVPDELVSRLAAELTRLAAHASSETARLATANATIERLRAFLEPFAESAAYFEVFGIYGGVQVRHLRDARAALKSNTGEKP